MKSGSTVCCVTPVLIFIRDLFLLTEALVAAMRITILRNGAYLPPGLNIHGKAVLHSDLFSINGLKGVTASDLTEAGAQALNAGVDIDLGATCYGTRAIEALHRGLISEEEIDTAMARILRLKFNLGLFENPYQDPSETELIVGCAGHRATALEAARQGIALLKNDNGLLPLDRSRIHRIAVIGPNADSQYNQLGDYTAPQPYDKITTVVKSIRRVAPDAEIVYARACAVRDTTLMDIPAAVMVARDAEVVQLYLCDVVASVSQPPMLLKGFSRIELSPGESRTTTFNLGAEELSIYNAGLERVIESGLFKVMIGASSADIRLTGDFTL